MSEHQTTATSPRSVLTNPAGVTKKRGRPKKEDADKDLSRKVGAAVSNSGAPEKAVRAKRSQAACQRCKTKKTKCDFGSVPTCCTRCAHDGAICKMGARKKIEFKQLPPGYGEMVEDNHLMMADVIVRMYKKLLGAGLWEHGEIRVDEQGSPILHDIVTCMNPISQQTLQICEQLDIDPVKSFPKNMKECDELAAEIRLRNGSITTTDTDCHSPASLTSDHTENSDSIRRNSSHSLPALDHNVSPATTSQHTLSPQAMGAPLFKATPMAVATSAAPPTTGPHSATMVMKPDQLPMTVNPSQLALATSDPSYGMSPVVTAAAFAPFNGAMAAAGPGLGTAAAFNVEWIGQSLTTYGNTLIDDMAYFNPMFDGQI
ncbi:Fluconazole resistance protein 1 [Ceratocystis fimbriata CBS 114723]|uniref:Fluconazole resistance protein 1 n=1 Tax=Ceratocystis fimbriata CBS 114723 TaxID=1035309 RepID=A0A2C5XAT6_9PEZI|nr:Fluconazole resistance protein 1 [Ceratocystis fimbriata CBS 114723]